MQERNGEEDVWGMEVWISQYLETGRNAKVMEVNDYSTFVIRAISILLCTHYGR